MYSMHSVSISSTMNLKVSTLNMMFIVCLIPSLKTGMKVEQNSLRANENNLSDINLIGQRKFLNEILSGKKQKTETRDSKNSIGRKLLSLEDDMTSNVSNATTKKVITVTTKINDTQTKNIKRASEYTSEQTTFINALPFSIIKYKALSVNEQKDTTSIDNVRNHSRYKSRDQDSYHHIITSSKHKMGSQNEDKQYQIEEKFVRKQHLKENNNTATKSLSILKLVDGSKKIYTSASYLTHKTHDSIQANTTARSLDVEESIISSFHTRLNQDQAITKSMNKNYNQDGKFEDSSDISSSLEPLPNASVLSMIRLYETTTDVYSNYEDTQRSRNIKMKSKHNSNMDLDKKEISKPFEYIDSDQLANNLAYSVTNSLKQEIDGFKSKTVIFTSYAGTTLRSNDTETSYSNHTSKISADQKKIWEPAYWKKWWVNVRYFAKNFEICIVVFHNLV